MSALFQFQNNYYKCRYAGCNVAEKGRFILTLFDAGMRGLLSLNELYSMIFVILEVLGNACQTIIKKKDVVLALDTFFRELETGDLVSDFKGLNKTITNTKATLREGAALEEDQIIGLVEMMEFCKYVSFIDDEEVSFL